MASDTPFRLLLQPPNGTQKDASSLVRNVIWSCSDETVARQVNFSILHDPYDPHLPEVDCRPGTAVDFLVGGESVFGGIILDRNKDSLGFDLDCAAYDWGVWMKKNDDYLKVEQQTAEDVAAQVAAMAGLTPGELADTGGALIDHNFLPASFYAIVSDMYTLAGETTGKNYRIRFRGRVMDVVEKKLSETSLVLEPGVNLLSCKTRESCSGVINAVKIYDDDLTLTDTVTDDESQALYGVFQTAILASSYPDAGGEAAKILRDNAPETSLSIETIGHPDLIAGNTVVVREPVTGTYGLFDILTDSHSWQKGVYRAKLTIRLHGLVDEEEVKQSGAQLLSEQTPTRRRSSAASSGSIVDVATQFLGVPYVWGGSDPSGFDCSGLVYYALNQTGVSVQRTTAQGYHDMAAKVSESTARPGDLIFFGTQGAVDHVGIYMGNGQMVNATGSMVQITDINTKRAGIISWGRIG